MHNSGLPWGNVCGGEVTCSKWASSPASPGEGGTLQTGRRPKYASSREWISLPALEVSQGSYAAKNVPVIGDNAGLAGHLGFEQWCQWGGGGY
jgi:hypothetical protein